jgi:hypothetical protein
MPARNRVTPTGDIEAIPLWHEQWQPHHYTFLYFQDEA